MTMKAGKAPDYRDRDYGPAKLQRRLPAIPQRIENELEVCESGIEAGLKSAQSAFRVVGKYVKRVLTAELWKKGDYSSFEDWCEKRWGWGQRRGYQIAEGEIAIESLPAELNNFVQNEGQARALAAVSKPKREAVLSRVVESGKPVTAKRIKEATKPRERKSKKKEPAVIDVTPEPPKPQKPVHNCPMCRCEQ